MDRIYYAAIQIAQAHDVESALQTVADVARDIADAEYAAVGVLGEYGKPLTRFITSGNLSHSSLTEPPSGHGILGKLLEGAGSLRLADIRDHPAFSGLPDGHVPVRSFLGLTVQVGRYVVGNLYMANKLNGEEFTAEDEQKVSILATHAAATIQTLRYLDQSHTLELLEERHRAASMLQDDVLQTMYGAGLLLHTLNLDDRDMALAQIQGVQRQLDSAITHLRQFLLGLSNPHIPDSPGIAAD